LLGGKPEVLLTGDVEKGSIEKLISTQSHRLAAPILQVPHHAGKVDKIEKFSREAHGALASVVQPTIAIAQTGRNRYDNPRLSTIAGLLEAEGPVPYIACSQLNTKCGDADEGNKHCAGTVSVLHGMGVVHFGRSEHHEFVAEACKGKARCKLSLPEIEELLAEDR